jgi:hypothetical protein
MRPVLYIAGLAAVMTIASSARAPGRGFASSFRTPRLTEIVRERAWSPPTMLPAGAPPVGGPSTAVLYRRASHAAFRIAGERDKS